MGASIVYVVKCIPAFNYRIILAQNTDYIIKNDAFTVNNNIMVLYHSIFQLQIISLFIVFLSCNITLNMCRAF